MNDEILTRYLLGETSEEENRAIETWMTEHPDNLRQFNHLKWIWENSKELAKVSTVNPDAAWERFRQKRSDAIRPSSQKPPARIRSLHWTRVAAGFLLVATIAFFGYFLVVDDSGRMLAVHLKTEDVPRTETLADGSVITLNKNTELSFSQLIWQDKRIIDLHSGEAFFQVQRDSTRPFTVRTPDVAITVLGTSFNVKKSPVEIEVIVETGRVMVESTQHTEELTPGEKVIVNLQNGAFDLAEVEDQLYRYYINQKLKLDHTPLWRVAEILESAFDEKIYVSEEIRDLPLTTTITADSLDHVLRMIAETFQITVEKRNDQIILQ